MIINTLDFGICHFEYVHLITPIRFDNRGDPKYRLMITMPKSEGGLDLFTAVRDAARAITGKSAPRISVKVRKDDDHYIFNLTSRYQPKLFDADNKPLTVQSDKDIPPGSKGHAAFKIIKCSGGADAYFALMAVQVIEFAENKVQGFDRYKTERKPQPSPEFLALKSSCEMFSRDKQIKAAVQGMQQAAIYRQVPVAEEPTNYFKDLADED